MEKKDYLIIQFTRLFKIDHYGNIIKLIPILLFIILSPFLIYNEFLAENYLNLFVLLFAEILFAFIAYSKYATIRIKSSFRKSRIYMCFQNKDNLNKIIISKSKILFDIIGMEDESINLKDSDYRDTIIASLKEFYGDSKIIFNV